MSINNTTLSAAIGATDTQFGVGSATGITAPNFTTGAGLTYLLIDQEYILVVALSGTTVTQCLRGQLGTAAVAHVINSLVQAGGPGDFPATSGYSAKEVDLLNIVGGFNLPATFLAGATDAIPAGVPGFYVVKTAGVNAMTLAAPTAAQEGNIIDIWSDTTNAHTLTATSLLANGTALKTTATFPAFRGAGLRLRVCNLVYHVMSNGASAGAVVLT